MNKRVSQKKLRRGENPLLFGQTPKGSFFCSLKWPQTLCISFSNSISRGEFVSSSASRKQILQPFKFPPGICLLSSVASRSQQLFDPHIDLPLFFNPPLFLLCFSSSWDFMVHHFNDSLAFLYCILASLPLWRPNDKILTLIIYNPLSTLCLNLYKWMYVEIHLALLMVSLETHDF